MGDCIVQRRHPSSQAQTRDEDPPRRDQYFQDGRSVLVLHTAEGRPHLANRMRSVGELERQRLIRRTRSARTRAVGLGRQDRVANRERHRGNRRRTVLARRRHPAVHRFQPTCARRRAEGCGKAHAPTHQLDRSHGRQCPKLVGHGAAARCVRDYTETHGYGRSHRRSRRASSQQREQSVKWVISRQRSCKVTSSRSRSMIAGRHSGCTRSSPRARTCDTWRRCSRISSRATKTSSNKRRAKATNRTCSSSSSTEPTWRAACAWSRPVRKAGTKTSSSAASSSNTCRDVASKAVRRTKPSAGDTTETTSACTHGPTSRWVWPGGASGPSPRNGHARSYLRRTQSVCRRPSSCRRSTCRTVPSSRRRRKSR